MRLSTLRYCRPKSLAICCTSSPKARMAGLSCGGTLGSRTVGRATMRSMLASTARSCVSRVYRPSRRAMWLSSSPVSAAPAAWRCTAWAMAGCAAAACFRKLAKSVGAGCAWASASSAGFLRVSAPAAPLHARAMLMARARVEALNGWFFMVVGLSMNAEAARIRALQAFSGQDVLADRARIRPRTAGLRRAMPRWPELSTAGWSRARR